MTRVPHLPNALQSHAARPFAVPPPAERSAPAEDGAERARLHAADGGVGGSGREGVRGVGGGVGGATTAPGDGIDNHSAVGGVGGCDAGEAAHMGRDASVPSMELAADPASQNQGAPCAIARKRTSC